MDLGDTISEILFGSRRYNFYFEILLKCLVTFFLNLVYVRGDVKNNWLQPPYSAASCSQLIKEMLYIALECCSILAGASSSEF